MQEVPREVPPKTGDASTPACHGFGVGWADRGGRGTLEDRSTRESGGLPLAFPVTRLARVHEPRRRQVLSWKYQARSGDCVGVPGWPVAPQLRASIPSDSRPKRSGVPIYNLLTEIWASTFCEPAKSTLL